MDFPVSSPFQRALRGMRPTPPSRTLSPLADPGRLCLLTALITPLIFLYILGGLDGHHVLVGAASAVLATNDEPRAFQIPDLLVDLIWECACRSRFQRLLLK